LNIEKIEKDSIYNTVKPKNMTRFSNLPKKAPKGNLPLTFHKKIRSSGYGTKPEALKFSKSKQKKKTEAKLFVTRDFYSYPLPMEIPEETEFLNKSPLHTKPITKIQYSNNGCLLASVALDMTIAVMKTPAFETNFDISTFSGHDAKVNSLNFSSKDSYLLSTSSDKSAVLWSIDFKRGKKALVIDRVKNSLPDDASKPTKDNTLFTHDIKKASFYYGDKFITL
jgi:WD40 repeat protein